MLLDCRYRRRAPHSHTMRDLTMKWLTGLAAGLALSAGTVHAADKWDMPTAYVDTNYHTQNGKLFAEAVGVCTGSDLEIVVHGGGTLFKGGEIKRARTDRPGSHQ